LVIENSAENSAGREADEIEGLFMKIVPFMLKQFANLFKAPAAAKGALDSKLIEDLLRDCLAELNSPALALKIAINERVDRSVAARLSA